MPTPLAFRLHATGHAPIRLSDSPRKFRKDVIRVGTFYAPSPTGTGKIELAVTPDRLDRWVSNFELMRQRGIRADHTVDHVDRRPGSAYAKIGEITRLFRGRYQGDELVEDPQGDVLGCETELADEEAERLATRSPEVSLELDRDWTDGLGNRYDEAITAITTCRKPVVPGQRPYQRIAASTGTADGLVLDLVANEPHNEHPRQGTTAMKIELSDQQLQAAITATGLGSDATPEALAGKLVELAGQGKIAGEKLTTLSRERDTLKGQVDELRAKVPSEPSPELKELQDQLIGQERETVEGRIDGLVRASRLTPQEGDDLKKLVVGLGDTPNRTMLSRTGGERSLGSRIVAKVEEILSKTDRPTIGQQSGPQTVTLGRYTPGDPNSDADLDALDKRVRERAGAKV